MCPRTPLFASGSNQVNWTFTYTCIYILQSIDLYTQINNSFPPPSSNYTSCPHKPGALIFENCSLSCNKLSVDLLLKFLFLSRRSLRVAQRKESKCQDRKKGILMASFDSWQDSGLTPTLSLMGGRDLRGSCTRGKSKTMRVIWQSRERACVRVHALSLLSVVRRGGWGMGTTFIHIHLVSCHEHRQHKGRIEDQLWQGIMVMGTLVKRSKANCRYSYPAHTTRLAACRKKMKTCKKYKYKYSQTSPAGTDCLFLFPHSFPLPSSMPHLLWYEPVCTCLWEWDN